MKVRYVTLDVFTETRFGGNPLAVVLDADDLETTQMQAIAAEFGYSESTFVCRPKSADNTAHVRIFTPMKEVPFAGHPNVGTAVALILEKGDTLGEQLLFEEGIGLVPIVVDRRNGGPIRATLSPPEVPTINGPANPEQVVAAGGLALSDLKTGRHVPTTVSLGLRFTFAEVQSKETLGRIEANPARFVGDLGIETSDGLYFYTSWGTEEDLHVQSRLFAPEHGIVEDPATGSAAAALAGLHAHLAGEDLAARITIDQGVEMRRPSRIDVQVWKSGGTTNRIDVGGCAIPVMSGMIEL